MQEHETADEWFLVHMAQAVIHSPRTDLLLSAKALADFDTSTNKVC
jgi:hypothetical protein